MIKKIFGACLMITICSATTFAQKRPELAKTPPMGWNSWNYFGKKDINEKIVYQVIDAMVSSGLKDAGYNYVIIDGGWRDSVLAKDGRLLPHPTKFPHGIKALADYAHSKGLKFGLHTVPGTHDCGSNPVGGLGHEEVQIQQFVDWGLDFVKLDRCKMSDDPCSTCDKSRTGWSEESTNAIYKKWSKLLYNSKRKMLFSVSAYKFRDWNPEYCNMSRTTYDIIAQANEGRAVFEDGKRDNSKSFLSVMACAEFNDKCAKYAGHGYWNDPDMLVVGNKGLTPDEAVSHFALWAIMNSPLMLGNDPRNMSARDKALLLNKRLIAVNQDNSPQGKLVEKNSNFQIWKKTMSDGSTTLLLLNTSATPLAVTANFKKLKLPQSLKVKDVVSGQNLGLKREQFSKTLASHATCMIRVSK